MDSAAQPLHLINWDLAASTAARLAGPGPHLSRAAIGAVVADLHRHAQASVPHVHRITGLEAARDLRDSEVLVVDRPSWSRANLHSFEALLDPVLRHVAETKGAQVSPGASLLGGTVTGAELGSILAFLSANVLGQYDPFSGILRPGVPEGGRLLLVAPNIVEIERELGVEPSDFRLWVCLHEQTHRVQFAAAPWLRDHLRESIATLANGMIDKADGLGGRLRQAAAAAVAARREGRGDAPGDDAAAGPGLLSVLQDPADRAAMSHLTAVMSLLEGHANVVMDAVDSSVVPTVKTIRQRFSRRGENRTPLERWVRRVLGFEAKMRQYRDGQRFVSAVVDAVGMDRFNTIWDSPETLPTEHELHHPQAWIDRVLGGAAPGTAGR